MTQFKTDKIVGGKYTDADHYLRTMYEGKLQSLDFQYLANGKIVKFRAFMTDFSQNFNADWKSNEVYARMDDTPIYKRTTRSINLAWDIPAYSLLDAEENLEALSELVKFLYPVYDTVQPRDVSGANVKKYKNTIANSTSSKRAKVKLLKTKTTTEFPPEVLGGSIKNKTFDKDITSSYQKFGLKNRKITHFAGHNVGHGTLKSAPLLKVKLSNLISNARKDLPQTIGITGVVGKISSLSIDPDLESGMFDPNEFILPKMIKVTATFDVIHGHQLGWTTLRNNFLGGRNFPFGEFRSERANTEPDAE